MMIGLRNAGSHFRRMIAGEQPFAVAGSYFQDPGFIHGDLTGKTVGLIGCGYIGRRLIQLLEPFHVRLLVFDPYLPREMADVYDMDFTSLEQVMSVPDVVVCLVPITPATRGMLGADEFSRLRPGAVFVNVSRGAVVRTDALIERLSRGDVVACLDVFDPEPVPADSPILRMPNVFVSPHIAGETGQTYPDSSPTWSTSSSGSSAATRCEVPCFRAPWRTAPGARHRPDADDAGPWGDVNTTSASPGRAGPGIPAPGCC